MKKARWPRIIEKTRAAPAFIQASVPDHWEAKPSPTRPAPSLLLLGGMVCSEACHPQNLGDSLQQETESDLQNCGVWYLAPSATVGIRHTTLLFSFVWLNTSWCQLIRDYQRSGALCNLRCYKNLRRQSALSECSKSPRTEGHVHLARTVRHRTWEEMRLYMAQWLCGYRLYRDCLNLFLEEVIDQYRSTIPYMPKS